jgi:hypothetical protein
MFVFVVSSFAVLFVKRGLSRNVQGSSNDDRTRLDIKKTRLGRLTLALRGCRKAELLGSKAKTFVGRLEKGILFLVMHNGSR